MTRQPQFSTPAQDLQTNPLIIWLYLFSPEGTVVYYGWIHLKQALVFFQTIRQTSQGTDGSHVQIDLHGLSSRKSEKITYSTSRGGKW